MNTKEEILKVLHKYDQPMSDPFYSGIEMDEFNNLAEEIVMIDRPIFNPRFDIDRKDLYYYRKPELKVRTRKRLIEIALCGMEEVMTAQFGYKDVVGGLYIERVWNDSDETFADYMQWAKGLIIEHLNKLQ